MNLQKAMTFLMPGIALGGAGISPLAGLCMRLSHVVIGSLFLLSHSYASGREVVQPRIESLTLERCASQPVIVFENGSGATFDTWGKVIASIKMDATIFAYNRPGYGNSEETRQPRDGLTIVDELRSTLRRQGLQPPYILVGHSLGGLYSQVFARAYPQEVKALVLVDSIWPGTVKKTDDFPLYTRIAKRLFFSRTINQEIDEIHKTGIQALALPWSKRIPVERLINVPKSKTAIGVNFGAFHSGPAVVEMVNGLYPNANTTIVDASHQIQVTSPEVVVSAIRRVMPLIPATGCLAQVDL